MDAPQFYCGVAWLGLIREGVVMYAEVGWAHAVDVILWGKCAQCKYTHES